MRNNFLPFFPLVFTADPEKADMTAQEAIAKGIFKPIPLFSSQPGVDAENSGVTDHTQGAK